MVSNPLAFPHSALMPSGPTMYSDSEGMTLRDYFAAKAMAAMVSSQHCPDKFDEKVLAKMAYAMAYAMADAMLEARE